MDYTLLGILITVVLQALFFGNKMGRIEKSIETLEKEQKKHNNLIERTYKNEKDISVLNEQMKVGNHRIDDIEEVQNECFKHRD